MTASLERLNALPARDAEEELLGCCGSRGWAQRMAASRPFGSDVELAEEADRVWRDLSETDWLEAFAAHPRIGDAGTDPADLPPPQPSQTTQMGTTTEMGTDLFNGSEQKIDLSPFSRSREWSRQEQATATSASPETLANLADANRAYEERFGRIFIVCASGKNAGEMLRLLESRLGNDSETELAIAAEEQRKITRLRLQKLLGEAG